MAVNELGRWVTATITEQGEWVATITEERGRRAFIGVGTQTVSPNIIGGEFFPGYAEGYAGAGYTIFAPTVFVAQLSVPLIDQTGATFAPTVNLTGANQISPGRISSVGAMFSPVITVAGISLPILPTLLVEMDREGWISGPHLDDPGALLDTAMLGPLAPTFAEDIAAYVRAADTQRGAQRELQRVEAGTASLILDNRDSRFTPFNIGSPYYPDVLPMRRIRIKATWGGVTYPIYYGFVESWPVTFNDTDMTTQISLVDGFKVLSLAFISGDFIEQGSGARVTAILDATGWPIADRDIDVGVVTVPAITLTNVSALEHLQQIERAEGGRFFIGRDGKAVFKDRTAQVNPSFTDRTWADDGTGMTYRDVVIVCNDDLILNDIHMTREGGVEQTAEDFASQNDYGIRSTTETGIQLSSDVQVADLADVTLLRYSQPVQRLEGLVDNAMQHRFWDRVLARELDDYALVIETRTATAQVSIIEGISHSIQGDEWIVTLAMSPTIVEQAGILDDPTYGLLDSTAILVR